MSSPYSRPSGATDKLRSTHASPRSAVFGVRTWEYPFFSSPIFPATPLRLLSFMDESAGGLHFGLRTTPPSAVLVGKFASRRESTESSLLNLSNRFRVGPMIVFAPPSVETVSTAALILGVSLTAVITPVRPDFHKDWTLLKGVIQAVDINWCARLWKSVERHYQLVCHLLGNRSSCSVDMFRYQIGN